MYGSRNTAVKRERSTSSDQEGAVYSVKKKARIAAQETYQGSIIPPEFIEAAGLSSIVITRSEILQLQVVEVEEAARPQGGAASPEVREESSSPEVRGACATEAVEAATQVEGLHITEGEAREYYETQEVEEVRDRSGDQDGCDCAEDEE